MNPRVNLPDEEIVRRLTGQASDEERKEALRQIFLDEDLRTVVFAHVRRHNGITADAEEVFQETLLLFERAVREGRYAGRSTLRTYFVGIAKWHWLNTRRKQNRHIELQHDEHPDETTESPEVHVLDEESRTILDSAIATLGTRCREILRLWLLGYSPHELSDQFGLSTAGMAKKESYRCRERLKTFFDNNPHLRDLLKRR